MEFKKMKTFSKVNELGYVEWFHKFWFIASPNQNTDWVAQSLLRIIKQEYLSFVRSSISDIWIESVNIVGETSDFYKIEVIFGDIND